LPDTYFSLQRTPSFASSVHQGDKDVDSLVKNIVLPTLSSAAGVSDAGACALLAVVSDFGIFSPVVFLGLKGFLMFTGLIEEIGVCLELRRRAEVIQLLLTAPGIAPHVKVGDSVAVNGCCLTAVQSDGEHLHFDLLDETLQRTNLGELSRGSAVNLEQAVRADGRMGGHFVQGHVDCTAAVIARDLVERDLRLELELPTRFSPYVAWKGSICVNGVSLTVASLTDASFSVYLIPQTRGATNLGKLSQGSRVNLEFDILAKYAERIMTRVPQ
jgi:riboflavin synthase